MLRPIKVLFVVAVAFGYSLIVFNNFTDYDSNYLFFSHDLINDAILPSRPGLWQAFTPWGGHTALYLAMVLWELLVMALCWWGAVRLAGALGMRVREFHQAQRVATAGLALGLAMWVMALVKVEDQWSIMWQSKSWNGHQGVAGMVAFLGIALLVVTRPDA
ncbi:MAG: DUF2165 domain-containing protein [Terriglobia bacterium]